MNAINSSIPCRLSSGCIGRTKYAKTPYCFPALRSVVSPNEFDAMGEDFEKDERQKFSEDGFEKVVS